VVSVEDDGEDEVFCAVVEGTHSFALEDNILTGNCHYGEDRAKPTDLWGAPFPREWRPQPPCKTDAYGCGPALGDMSKRCHTAAPRGARTGTQGLDRSSTRAKVPYALSMEMCKAAEVSVERKVVA
jgi:hypothetical protein